MFTEKNFFSVEMSGEGEWERQREKAGGGERLFEDGYH